MSQEHDHSHEGHTHNVTVMEMMVQGMQQHIEMLSISDRISRKALLILLPNVGDKVTVQLDQTKRDEQIMNDEGTTYLTEVTIVRIEGDTLDLLLG